MQADKMANEVLKQVLQLQLVGDAINPSSVMDVLFSTKVINFDDYNNLCQFMVVERCFPSSQVVTSSGVHSSCRSESCFAIDCIVNTNWLNDSILH